jgi:metal-sulfur cluster biosynthetic enzyme
MLPSDDQLTKSAVMDCLSTVMDPETNLSIVAMGLIYDVTITKTNGRPLVHILYTLTTPGCPLAGVLQSMMSESLAPLRSATFDPEQDTTIELTFDPPWVPEMMSEAARAELGWLEL